MAEYDVFLSYNRADKLAVEDVARRLVKEGIHPWLDEWNLSPGDPWMEAIEKALGQCGACAVFIGPSGTGPWQNEEMRAAINRRVTDPEKAFRVIPVLLPGAERGERSKLPDFLVNTTWVEFHDTLDDADAFRRLVCGIRGIEPGPAPGQAAYEGACPYRGLQFFDVEHAPFFFGREALTEWLLTTLRGDNRFLAIIGPSGSGKSSLARAGLVAALKRGEIEGSAEWPVVICRPGRDPLESLAVELSRYTPDDALDLAHKLGGDSRRLHITTRVALRDAPPERRLVVLVDQFEEVFTVCRDGALRRGLIDSLLYAASVAGGQTMVLLSMRADFYGKCAPYPTLAAALSDHQLLVGPMSEVELRRAIERPVQLVGCEFEQGLVERLLGDVEDQPGGLPLLQYALLELWGRRQGRRLTHAGYQAIGGVEGALERKAEAVYRQFGEPEQEICRRIFLRLTQPGEGTEDTKRRASLQELLPAGGGQETTEAVVQRLADAETRLVTTEGGDAAQADCFVEVAHEALIRSWPRLRGWIEEDREALRVHHRVAEAAQEWERNERDDSYLYRGARLAESQEWADSHADDLSPLEQQFIDSSVAAHRRARIQRVGLGLAALLVIVGALAMLAIIQSQAATRERDIAATAQAESTRALHAEATADARRVEAEQARAETEAQRLQAERQGNINAARELKARAQVQMDANAECALALAVEGYDRASGIAGFSRYEFEDVVRKALLGTRVQATLTGHEGVVNSVAWSPDGQWLASTGNDGTVRIWDARTGENTTTLSGHTGFVFAVAWSPDGGQLASGDGSGSIRIWDPTTGETVATLTGHTEELRGVAYSPDGRLLASASDDATVRLWDVGTGENVAKLEGHFQEVYGVSWSPDGGRLASASFDGRVRVWDVSAVRDTGVGAAAELATLESLAGQFISVAWSPDGQHLASALASGDIQIWDVDAQRNIVTLTGHRAGIWSVAWRPGEQWLASASEDGTIRLWDVSAALNTGLKTAESVAVFTGHTDIAAGVAWSPDGRQLASAARDGTVRLWRMEPAESVAVLTTSAENRGLTDAAWSPNGQWLAAANAYLTYGEIRLWNLDKGESTSITTNHVSTIQRISWSPEGDRLASAGADNSVHLYAVDSGQRLATLSRHTAVVNDVAWSPDGGHLASASNDFTVRLWDADTEQNIATLHGHSNNVFSVAWSPDGGRLASVSFDGTVRLWDVSTALTAGGTTTLTTSDSSDETTLTLTGHESPVASVAWSPDGGHVASGGTNGTIIVWDTETGERTATLTGHSTTVWDLAWSPDGSQLASASNDGTARLWDASSGETIATLTGHTGAVRAVTWSPDGRRLASAGLLDHTLRIHYVDFEQDVLPIATAHLERGSTPQERAVCLGTP